MGIYARDYSLITKMKMKMKNRSNRYSKFRPRSRQGRKYSE